MKIVADENISLVKEAFSGLGEVVTVPGRSMSKELLNDATVLLVRSVTKVNQELLDGTSVRFVASATIGTDHIDTKYLQENSIGFAYAPGSNAASVAEYVVCALQHMSMKTERPLESMTLGIIGVGNIGSKVYQHAERLGMRCLLNDPPKKRLTGHDIYIPLNQLVEEADVLSLHVPLISAGEDSTYHLVNHELIGKMKKNAILINTSRGQVVDEKSVRAEQAKFGGIILDVWENEPDINAETLKIVDIGTPHIAGYSFEGKIRGTQMIYEAACAYFFKRPQWQVSESCFTEIVKEIDVSSSVHPVADAVQKAYSIEDDHRSLRAILKKDKAEYGKFFDDLRKNYPRRREFTHFLVKCSEDQKNEARIINELGFPTQIIP